MSATDTEQLSAKDQQRKKAKRATIEKLRAKKPRRLEFEIVLVDGEDPVSFLYESIGNVAYDELVSKYSATPAQRARGWVVDQPKFGPAVLARVCAEPKISVEEWTEIWNSDRWGQGELSTLYANAVDVCTAPRDIAPIEAD